MVLFFLCFGHVIAFGQETHVATIRGMQVTLNDVSETNTISISDLKKIHQFIITGPESYKYIVFSCHTSFSVYGSPFVMTMHPKKNEMPDVFKKVATNTKIYFENFVLLDTITRKYYKLPKPDLLKITVQ